ncbi:Glycerol-1-phosphate dehydrogenase [NAD(P)+] [Gossypium arboreum]|uniref:Glycerol-1-phosphate dehydrogenase [NAD(P)+] n=1 Tax=Gossypium arboreum TaxID=29729 RepID=A0A0B0PHI4_GOSAR|nr:Glycerol-1-phosphate dehydrogenase [NAD(P)+] [Gossypium arboreum]
MYIPVPFRNSFILILIIDIPNEPLRIISGYSGNLAHKVSHIHQWACSHKLSVKM